MHYMYLVSVSELADIG